MGWVKIKQDMDLILPKAYGRNRTFSVEVLITDGQLNVAGELNVDLCSYNFAVNMFTYSSRVDNKDVTHWMYIPKLL
jgi:hypothetical protein